MLMFKLPPRLPETVRLLRAMPGPSKTTADVKPCAQRPARPISVERAPLDRATARALVDAGYMPMHRYVELFDESAVEPPYNTGNFGEGEV